LIPINVNCFYLIMAKRFAIPSLADIENSPKDEIPPKMLFTQYKKQSSEIGKNVNSVVSKNTSSSESVISGGSIAGSSQAVPTSVGNNTAPAAAVSSSAESTSSSDKPAALPTPSSNALIVSTRQRGNPLLKHVRNVTWAFGDIVADYQMAPSRCALFLSLRYHALNPTYIHERLKQLGHTYELRVLLVQIDVKETQHALKELASICMLSDCTLLVAWSAEAAARYLETYKAYEDKPPDIIMEKTDTNFIGRVTDVLTSVKKVNKTDAATLLAAFKSMRGVVEADKEDLALCPGLGPLKAQRLHHIFHEPFLMANKASKKAKAPSKPGASNQ